MPNDVIGQINGEDAEGRFQEWVLHQDRVWVDREGKVHLIERMDSDYILNVLMFLLTKHGRTVRAAATVEAITKGSNHLARTGPTDAPVIAALRDELLARAEEPAKERRYERVLIVPQNIDGVGPVGGRPEAWNEADLVLGLNGFNARVLKDRWGGIGPAVSVVRPERGAIRREVTTDPIHIESVLRTAMCEFDRPGEDAVVIDYIEAYSGHRTRRAIKPTNVGEKFVHAADLLLEERSRSFRFDQIAQVEGPMTEAAARRAVVSRRGF